MDAPVRWQTLPTQMVLHRLHFTAAGLAQNE